MEHYICKGTCKGVSKTPVNCGDKDCVKTGLPLEQCGCGGGAEAHASQTQDNTEKPSTDELNLN
jgi:hypothetical protein